ncbi:MAG: hypothetical protein Q9208_000752 [Pyrenodesmia sp. 3 TL-2023]
MQPKKVLSAATAAALLPRRADSQSLFDDAGKPKGANETIYGPLKVIEIPRFPSTFHEYPDKIDPETRKVLINGGLHPICGNCNSTGCSCPDRDSITFNGLCEGCRATGDGALRCYCSPALDATPCGGPDAITKCKDQVEDCQNVLPLYFCEPQRWDQNPELQNLATPSVVYDFQSATIMPPGVNALPTDPFDRGQTLLPTQGPQFAQAQDPQPGSAGKKGANAGAAAIAVAAAAAWMM